MENTKTQTIQKTFKSFYDFMKTYNTQELREIAEHGCVSGCANGLVYYSDTIAFYDAFDDELHEQLADWVNCVGEQPDFIAKELGNATGFKNAVVWFVAEKYANDITDLRHCEEKGLL